MQYIEDSALIKWIETELGAKKVQGKEDEWISPCPFVRRKTRDIGTIR